MHVWSADVAAAAGPSGERASGVGARQLSALRVSPGGDVLLCGFDDGRCTAWSLHGRGALFSFVPAPSRITCLVATEGHLLLGTACSRLVLYLWPTEPAENARNTKPVTVDAL
jgi:hypothetical protein